MKEKLLKARNWGNKNISWILSILLSSMFLIVALWGTGICFETNDDRCISDILAGVRAESPNAHVVYVNYLLAFPLVLLYKLTLNVSWYGILLIIMHLFVYITIAYQVFNLLNNRVNQIVAFIMLSVFLFAHIYMMGEIQYTSTAALLAVSGYICLLGKGKRKLFFFFLFEMFAYLLRSKAMLMIQPIGLAAVVSLSVLDDNVIKEKVKYWIRVGSIIILVFGIGFVGNTIGYANEEWENYSRYNEARTQMFDFVGTLSYEEAQPILDKYDVTEAEYLAFLNYTILDWDISVECIEELAAYTTSNRQKKLVLTEVVREFVTVFKKDRFCGVTFLSLLTVGALGIWCTITKRWKVLMSLMVVLLSYFMLITFLVWQGRMPERVIMPLAFATTIIALMLFFIELSKCDTKIGFNRTLMAGCMIFGFISIPIVIPQYRYVNQLNTNKEIYITGMQELEDYCRKHPENRYLVEAFSASYCQGSALDISLNQQKNSIVTGCWYSNSPVMRQKLKSYLDVETEQIKLIINAEGVAHENVVIEYLENKIGKVAIEEACFSVSHGGVYKVYGFYDAQ